MKKQTHKRILFSLYAVVGCVACVAAVSWGAIHFDGQMPGGSQISQLFGYAEEGQNASDKAGNPASDGTNIDGRADKNGGIAKGVSNGNREDGALGDDVLGDDDCVSGQVLIVASATLDDEQLQWLFAGAGVRYTGHDVVANYAASGTALLQVHYEGSTSPQDVSEALVQSDVIESAMPNIIMYPCDQERTDTAQRAEDIADLPRQNADSQFLPLAQNEMSKKDAFCGTLVPQTTTINDFYAQFNGLWQLDATGAYEAWDTARAEGKVTVAVVDSGVDYDHPDLKDNLVTDYAKNIHTRQVGGPAVDDADGHGTHICGLVAATANNNEGVAGISYNAKILPIKATYATSSGEGMSLTDTLEAFEYVVELKEDPTSPAELQNIRVINFSYGIPASDYSDYLDTIEQVFVPILQRVHDAGILFVCAAGNYANDQDVIPACYDHVMVVSNLERSGNQLTLHHGSSYGENVDIAAPGTTVNSTVVNGTYGSKTGTSMAAPVAAGAAALLFSCRMNATPDEIAHIMYETADDLGAAGKDAQYGHGALRLDKAVDMVMTLPDIVSLQAATVLVTEPCIYTGAAIEPAFTVTYNGTELVRDTDYQVSFDNNVNAGQATILLTGIGEYQGTALANFAIAPAVLTAAYGGETIYEGETPVGAITITGFVNGETPETAAGYVAPALRLPKVLEAGTAFTLAPDGGSADNYTFAYVAGVLTINSHIDLADTTALEAAIALVPEDMSGYTDESVAAVEAAKAAAEELLASGPAAEEQDAVDEAAQALKNAVAALEEKANKELTIEVKDITYKADIITADDLEITATIDGEAYDGELDVTFYADEECTTPATPLEVGTYYIKTSAAGAENAVASFRIDHIDIRTLWPDLQNDNKWYMKETAVLEGTETMIMDYMAGTGLITGSKNADGSVSFLPGKNITRGQLAVILCRAAGEPAPQNPAANANFSDLKDGAYYVNAVNWAFENHVVNGSGGKFRPNDNVTRQEFAAMLANYAEHIEGIDIKAAGADVDLSTWTDGGKVSGWAQDSVKYLCAINAMGGSADLKPASNATRAEASKMVAVLMHDIVGLGALPAE